MLRGDGDVEGNKERIDGQRGRASQARFWSQRINETNVSTQSALIQQKCTENLHQIRPQHESVAPPHEVDGSKTKQSEPLYIPSHIAAKRHVVTQEMNSECDKGLSVMTFSYETTQFPIYHGSGLPSSLCCSSLLYF